MDVAVTGSTGLIGTALRPRLEADGHTVVPVVRRPVGAGEAALRWDPDAGTIDAAVARGDRRGGPPGRRRHRRQALDATSASA